MPTPGSGAIGALDLPDAQRKQFAQLSKTWTCPDCRLANCDLLPSAAVNGDSSNADAKTPTNITEDGRPAEPYRFPTAATKESVGGICCRSFFLPSGKMHMMDDLLDKASLKAEFPMEMHCFSSLQEEKLVGRLMV